MTVKPSTSKETASRARRAYRRTAAASSPAPKLSAPPTPTQAGPTLEEQLIMSRSETATANERIAALRVELAAALEKLDELQIAKAEEAEPIAAVLLKVGRGVGPSAFVPDMVRHMRKGDVFDITHTGEELEIVLRRPKVSGDGADCFDLFG